MRALQPRRVRSKTLVALSAAIVLAVGGCDGGRRIEAISATPSTPGFLDPLTDGQQAQALFVVEADDAEYWRMSTLDQYDGDTWTSADLDGSEGIPLSVPALLPRSESGRSLGGTTLIQTFRIVDDVRFGSAHPLLMAQTAEEIEGSIPDITWDATRSLAFLDRDLRPGVTYSVRSRIVVPTPDELDRVDHLAPSAFGRWTALPADLDPRIAQIAERWTTDAKSDYRKVLAIQQRFQEEDFVYSTDVDTAVDGDALVEFLTRTKIGFCQHYSSAMAVMVRTLGLPSRIGVGFRSGTRQEDGSFLVSTSDAHVWVEVLFPGYGWLQFEPEAGTPHPNAQPGTYLNP
jgi:hypothetical protein